MPGQKAPETARREQILNAAYEVALRDGIDGMTLRAVAAEADLSHGLVLFHFKRRDELIAALLDRVLATTAMREIAADPGLPTGDRRERLRLLLHHEIDRLAFEPGGMRLFLEYWTLGLRTPAIRERLGDALDRYRAAFRALAAEILAGDDADDPYRPDPDADRDGAAAVTPEVLATLAVSLVHGHAVQSMIDPHRFDSASYRAAVDTLVERLATPGTRLGASGAATDWSPAVVNPLPSR